jgi:polysaccharide chain length determinant protein (PEP-CTERM system associated)
MPDPNASLNFAELFDELRNVVLGAWRHRWKALLVTCVISVIGWVIVLALPNTYEASSRMFIDTESSLEGLLEGMAIRTDKRDEALIQVKSLKSRPTLERIGTVAGLLPVNATPDQIQAVVGKMQDSIMVLLDNEQILSVNFEHTDPQIALSVVSQLMDGFVDGLMKFNRSDSNSAQDFLEEKLDQYGKLLADAEARLADFKKQNIGLMPGERGDYFARLQQEQEVLRSLNFRLRLAREQKTALEQQIAGEAPTFFGIADPTSAAGVPGSASNRIAQYEEELARLRVQYTDSHPDIVAILDIIEDIREQEAEARQLVAEDPLSENRFDSLEENPVYQSMKIQLSSIELEVIRLQSEQASQQTLVNDLREKVDIIPEIEARLTELTRNYDVNKAQYDALLQRLESARLTEAAEESTNIDFRFIDPVDVTTFPVGPNRPLLMTGVLLLALGAGGTLAVLLSFMRPVFFSIRSLEKRFRVPVLGGIRYISSPELDSANRVRMFAFVGCLASIVAVYGVLLIFNQAGSRLVGQLIVLLG